MSDVHKQAAASSTPQPMDLSAYGAQELDSFQKASREAKAKPRERTRANPRTMFPRRRARSVARLVTGKKTAGTTSLVIGRTTSPRTRARAKTARTRLSPTTSSRRTKTRRVRSAGMATARDTIPKIVRSRNTACRLWRVKNNRHHPLVRQARQRLSGFFLNALEEETELNSFESKLAGVLVFGIDSGAARSVVPAGEIPGYSEGQRNWSCVHVGYHRARVRSGKTADPGNCE